jgi:hypothetical protein
MRDIRSDLRERAEFLKEQINAANTAFEQRISEIRQQHDNQLRDLKATFDALNTLMKAEQQRFHDSQTLGQSQEAPSQKASPQAAQPDRSQSQPRLLDILIRKLSNDGPASCEQLHRWAVGAGYLANDATSSALHKALLETAEAGLIRQLPDGTFAAASVTDLIRLQRAF